MMTLEEAIIHCEDVANDRAGCCEDCAEEHRQLAEWLKELKAYREMTEPEMVRCVDCEHLRTMLTQRKHLPGGGSLRRGAAEVRRSKTGGAVSVHGGGLQGPRNVTTGGTLK